MVTSTQTSSFSLSSPITPETSDQKRAYSYANTIAKLFEQVMSSKQPADRVIGNYFREHKKHGSKDRRVIRETFFGLFRWWGWLQQIESQQTQGHIDFAHLYLCARLENHQWQNILQVWAEAAEISVQQQDISELALTSLKQKQQLVSTLLPTLDTQGQRLVPQWFWDKVNVPEQDQEKLIDAMISRPPIWARTQGITLAKAQEALINLDIEAQASEYFSDAISLGTKSINLDGIKLYKEGQLEIQDLASQVIGHICQPKPTDNWWDTCSGAGGKTLQLKSLMLQQDSKATGSITSSDIRPRILQELNKRAKRAKFNKITLSPWQSEALPVEAESYDGVLVDAPCSCLGTWRRNPDMRWIDTSDAVDSKPELQLDILSRSSRAVKSGGTLVYATCSLATAENEEVVNAFLANHPEFELEVLCHPFTGEMTQMLTVWPFNANSDGMFVVRMKKRA